ncbi:LysR family transcriptional regulator [Sphaerisporangium fuscum]|uniref:LysR family transcriptional regulator n=1 Tax=Sphaerisporangium fuscum TaxID=2835868 RepID=UPI001BDC82F6|nr:LysR family transcriptional regulator [Sphaerisporangium fuscum]
MELELRHLRILCAIAEAGSVGRAASILGYSQPAVSTQLSRIEGYFGRLLFERSASGVEPTPFGAEVLAQAHDLLTRAERIGRRRNDPAGRETLRLAATNTPILPGMAMRLQSMLPEVALTVSSVYATSDIVDLLESAAIDAAIAADYPGRELEHSAAISHRGVVTEPVFVALPATHRLRHRTELSLDELADEAWFLTPDDGAGWPGVFYSACRVAGFAPVVVHEFLGDRLQLQRMIAEGIGITVVQATTKPIAGVVIKPLVGTPLWCRYVLVWRREGSAANAAETLYMAAVEAYRELIGRATHFQSWAERIYRVF